MDSREEGRDPMVIFPMAASRARGFDESEAPIVLCDPDEGGTGIGFRLMGEM